MDFIIFESFRKNNKGTGQGARQGVAMDAARLVVNVGAACLLRSYCNKHDGPMFTTGRNTIWLLSNERDRKLVRGSGELVTGWLSLSVLSAHWQKPKI